MAPRWFGPKRIGWGWRPITAAGWAVTAVFGIVAVLLAILVGPWGVGVALVAYIALIAFTGGKPGHTGL